MVVVVSVDEVEVDEVDEVVVVDDVEAVVDVVVAEGASAGFWLFESAT